MQDTGHLKTIQIAKSAGGDECYLHARSCYPPWQQKMRLTERSKLNPTLPQAVQPATAQQLDPALPQSPPLPPACLLHGAVTEARIPSVSSAHSGTEWARDRRQGYQLKVEWNERLQ